MAQPTVASRFGSGTTLRPTSSSSSLTMDMALGTQWPGGRTGGSLFGVSTYSGHIRVVTSDCRLLWEETVAQSRGGAVAVAPDLSVRLVEHAPDGVGRPLGISGDAVPETGACLPEGTEYAPDDPYASPS